MLGLPSSFLLVSPFSLLDFLLLWRCFQIFGCVRCVSRELGGKKREQDFVVNLLFKELSFSLSCLFGREWLIGGEGYFCFISFFFLLILLQSPRHIKCTSLPSHYSCHCYQILSQILKQNFQLFPLSFYSFGRPP